MECPTEFNNAQRDYWGKLEGQAISVRIMEFRLADYKRGIYMHINPKTRRERIQVLESFIAQRKTLELIGG